MEFNHIGARQQQKVAAGRVGGGGHVNADEVTRQMLGHFAVGHAGLKRNPAREDISLVVSDLPATAAGVYTTNLVCAAPVTFDRGRTPGTGFRAVAINSGNANACTGTRGLADAQQMAAVAAARIGVEESAVLVLSTGIIGEFLPLAKIEAGLGVE